MPSSAVPIVAAIVAAFSSFIVVVGGVSIWSEFPVRKNNGSHPEGGG